MFLNWKILGANLQDRETTNHKSIIERKLQGKGRQVSFIDPTNY